MPTIAELLSRGLDQYDEENEIRRMWAEEADDEDSILDDDEASIAPNTINGLLLAFDEWAQQKAQSVSASYRRQRLFREAVNIKRGVAVPARIHEFIHAITKRERPLTEAIVLVCVLEEDGYFWAAEYIREAIRPTMAEAARKNINGDIGGLYG